MTIEIREKISFLGEFHHSKEGFLIGPMKKKGDRSFGGKNKKMRKNTLVAPPGE